MAATPVFADSVEQIARSVAPTDSIGGLAASAAPRDIRSLVLAGRVPLVERIYWNPKKLLVRHS